MIYDLDKIEDKSDLASMFGTPTLEGVGKDFERYVEANAYALGLRDGQGFPYQVTENGVVVGSTSTPQSSPGGPNADVSSSSLKGVLSRDQLVSVLAKAYPEAATGRWAGMPDWSTNEALLWLLNHESSWDPSSQNPTSTAYGLFQFLNSTWADYGVPKTSDPVQQAVAGLRYVYSRYGSPENAKAKWLSRSPHWY